MYTTIHPCKILRSVRNLGNAHYQCHLLVNKMYQFKIQFGNEGYSFT